MLRDTIAKHKAITVEILLPITSEIDGLCDEIARLKDCVDAVNVPSNPLGRLRPDALCCAHLIQEKTGIETIPHFVARHFTSLSFESHLLGASALGIENILCVTGDNPIEGRSSFELNSSRLLAIARSLSRGLTSARKAIIPVDFCLCTSVNPNVPNVQGEMVKTRMKYREGAEIFFTQPVFNPDRFIGLVNDFRTQCPEGKIIAGLSYLYTKKRAFALMKFLGIPPEYINYIEEKDESELLLETAARLKDFVDGFYVIPIGRYDKALHLVREVRGLVSSS